MAKLVEPIQGAGNDEFSTPQALFDFYDKAFHFGLDVSATPRNTKCRRFFTKSVDGLKQEWTGTVWMNPPYSQLGHWVKKAYESSLSGCTVVGLIPVWTDAKWFQDSCMHAEIQFLRGRVSFDGRPGFAPFSNMVVIWRPDDSVMKCSCVRVPVKDIGIALKIVPPSKKRSPQLNRLLANGMTISLAVPPLKDAGKVIQRTNKKKVVCQPPCRQNRPKWLPGR